MFSLMRLHVHCPILIEKNHSMVIWHWWKCSKLFQYRLGTDMIKGARIFDEFNETLEKLKKLAKGFNEGFHKKRNPRSRD